MVYLLSLIIPFFSFLFQSYPRFFNRYFGVDVWTRLIETDVIRINGHKIPKKKINNGFLIDGYFDYPPVFPWLLSFIPKKTLVEIQGFIAPFFDVLQNILIFLITYQITARIEIAFLAQLIYSSIPLIVLENSYLTPRSFGYLSFTLAFYPILLYSTSPNVVYLIFGFIFTVFCFFTHRFATQSLFFATIFFTFVDRSFLYLINFLLAFLVAVFISRGYYLRVLEGHVFNIYFWVKNYKYRFAHQLRGIVPNKKRDLVGNIYYLLGTFTPITLIGTNLWMIIPLYITLDSLFHLNFIPINQPFNQPLYFKMGLLVSFFYIFSVLVLSIKALIPIGEGQRYLEMVTTPTAVMSSMTFYFWFESNLKNPAIIIFVTILLTNISLVIFLQRVGIIKDKNRSLTKDMTRIFDFINKYKNPRILCIPHQITTMILYNTKSQVFVNAQTKGLMYIQDVYPVLKKPVSKLAKEYNLNLLVLKKDYANMKELKLTKKSLLFESEDTQIFKI